MSSLVINTRIFSTIEDRVQKAKFNPTIKNLSLREVHISNATADAVVDLLEGRHWERINVGDLTGRVDVIVRAISLALDNVERLVYLRGHQFENEALCTLGTKLGHTNSLRYLRLRVQFNEQNAIAFKYGLSQNKSLEHLHLQDSLFFPESIVAMEGAMKSNKNLKILELEGCSLPDSHLAAFIGALRSHPCLECLNLCRNQCGDLTLSELSALLQQDSCKLKKLDLGCQMLGYRQKMDITFLFDAVSCNTSLHELNLAGNELDDEAVVSICCALTANRSLAKLVLSDNRISDAGVEHFASKLSEMKGLDEVWLFGNNFGDVGAKHLVVASETNFDLQKVYIARSDDDSRMIAMQKLLTYHLCLNMGGRKLLRATNVPPALWALVFERAVRMLRWGSFVDRKQAQADVIFYLLKGPSLFHGV